MDSLPIAGPFALGNNPDSIYHMCIKEDFEKATTTGDLLYYPPTYQADGFIHATSDPKLLLTVANHFYKSSIGDWICLQINPIYLCSKVIYEAPAPVGNTKSMEASEQVLFPHIYGGINKPSVINIYPIVRSEDGSFLSIHSLVEN